jgi:predicted site-specific integrase-resolvase
MPICCKIERSIIAHKDRLSRFGFDYFEHYSTSNGCQIVVANQQSLSPEQEMIENLLTIVHSFSSRFYGLRKFWW